jgi:Terpene cyclase DEP1
MTSRERVLLALTIVGFAAPNVMVGVFIAKHGLDVGRYFNDWVQTLPAAQLGVDLIIAFVAFRLWAAWDGRRTGQRSWWVLIPASLLVGLCFAVPLFLLLRERTLRITQQAQATTVGM